ncbi:MAG: pyrroline-5-carboxylate reductase [Myxococcota bacterium]
MTQRIGVIGGGTMGTSLLRGLLEAEASKPEQIMVSDPREERRDDLAKTLKIATTASNVEVASFADVILLATKPQVFDRVLREIAPSTGPTKLVVSIAAGVSIASMEKQLVSGTRVVRCMPNTPALVREGATGIAAGTHASEEDLELVRTLFRSVGITETLEENLLDAVTGLSGSGPAFIFVVIEALSDAGVKMGLGRRAAQNLAAQTVLGAAKLLLETGDHPGRLKDMVCSPGGTTIAGLHTLESGGLRTTLIDAVEKATLRSKELGKDLEEKLG